VTRPTRTWLALLFAAAAAATAAPPRTVVAPTPPMGWNSWDSYGRTLDEQKIRANARWLAQNLKPFGWEYVVIDEGWYLDNLGADNNDEHVRFQLDAWGRYVPVPGRFPSAGEPPSFRPLADYLHGLGLKYGIHILRGIPREAVARNLPIAGSALHARDAADTTDVCPWNTYNYGLDASNPAAQAYYDSLARLYADWGIDFVKIDCIADHPFKGEEIRMFHEAVAKSGRAMVVSLSPGPTAIDKHATVARYSQMWRISDDVWDVWQSEKDFPTGVKNQFAHAAQWAGLAEPGQWPDADMLPIGSLRPAAGWGPARDSRLTRDEQRTLLTLWCIVRSPLIMGGNLLEADEWTRSLLTNAEVLAVDQHSRGSRPLVTSDDSVVWYAQPEQGGPGEGDSYLAVFNLSDSRRTARYAWKQLGLAAAGYRLRDLWEKKDLGEAAVLEVELPPHGSVLYRAAPLGR
jgi:hypothetical protein